MKIALVLLASFVSLTWQQNIFWSFPARHIPYYSAFNHDLPNDFAIVAASGPSGLQPYPNNYGYDGQGGVQERTLQGSNPYQRLNPKVESRSFGLTNYLASLILSSLTRLSLSSTSYTTTTSTITAGSVVTCFTRTMFNATTPCRRKREAMITIDASVLIGDGDDHNESYRNNDELESELGPLPREGRDMDPAHLVTSSKTENDVPTDESAVPKQIESSVDGYLRQNRNAVVTSSLTAYSVYYSTSTRTLTGLATLMQCLPTGFTLC